jgi:hypothetical protein
MHRKAWYFAVLPLVAAASPAVAGEPYYFHKPGIAAEAYVADMAACRGAASGQVEEAETGRPASVTTVAAVQLLAAFLNSRNVRTQQQAAETDCMAGKGYERVALDEAEFARIRRIEDNGERLEALFALATASTPAGLALAQ